MDSSALIFVALAVAWAVYLIPKALEHHEESARSRTVERFSHTMRVLARREPISRRRARLVAEKTTKAAKTSSDDAKPTTSAPETPKPQLTRAQLRMHRTAAARAARRRLRVVTLFLVANVVVAVLAGLKIIEWYWTAVPGGLLIAWLIACRLMVRREIAQLPSQRIPTESEGEDPRDSTEEIGVVATDDEESPVAVDPDSWDPVPVTLPTYVDKPVAPRSVRTIDLDSTGVWTSGRSEADSALVRQAEDATHRDQEERRAAGS